MCCLVYYVQLYIDCCSCILRNSLPCFCSVDDMNLKLHSTVCITVYRGRTADGDNIVQLMEQWKNDGLNDFIDFQLTYAFVFW